MKYGDYAKWAKNQNTYELWKPWVGKIKAADFGNQLATQDELLMLHYERWIGDPHNARTANTIIAFFESLESEYEAAVKVLGEDYFA